MVNAPNNRSAFTLSRVSSITFIVGVISIIGSLIIGNMFFQSSIDSFEQQYRQFYLREARMISKITELNKTTEDKAILDNIQTIWDDYKLKATDEYMCIVDEKSNLIIHTTHPDTIGNFVGKNRILSEISTPETCLGDLVKSQRDYVGDYSSSAGQIQLAAFTSVPDKKWVIGIHRSKDELIRSIEAGIRFSKMGFYIICGFVMPISWILIYLSFLLADRNRRGMEEELYKSEKNYRDILEYAVEGFFQSTADGHFISVNPAFSKMFGYDSPEALVRSPSGIATQLYADPQDRLRWQKIISKNGRVNNFEFIAKRKDGSTIWVSESARVIYDGKGEISSYEGTVRNITELKQNEERYRQTIESSIDGFWIVDKQAAFLNVNDSYCRMIGYGREELLKMSVFDVEAVESQNKTQERMQKIIKNGYDRFESKHRHKNGGIVDIEVSTTYTADGEVFFAFLRDITDRKKAEARLISQQYCLQKAQEIGQLGSWELDIQKNELIWTDENYKIFGLPVGTKITYDVFLNCIHPDDREYVDTKWKASFKGNPFDIEHRLLVDGKTKWVREKGELKFNEEGDCIKGIGFAQDITEQKRMNDEKIVLEARLQQAQKMESIGTLAGGIAHDFNNILFPVLGHAEMLLQDIPDGSPFRDSLKQIHTGALRAKGLVKQIITFSRQENSALRLMKVQPIIREALTLIRSTIPSTIAIKQDISPDCGLIKADPTQIHQIVMNLSTNAYHAMEETGGELKVTLTEMEFTTRDLIHPNMAPGRYACLTVADTGVGMDKSTTDKIFDPFFTTKAIGKGTGMGLSVVHGIVTAMGGAVHAYSEPGQGTQFYVYFPIGENGFEDQDIQAKEAVKGGSEHILLVDDEESILTMEKRMLERLGYQVTSRTSSLEALEVFRANPENFDLVITDLAMPDMTGDRLSAELIKINSDIRILLCTGFSESMSEEKAASSGINGFLFKPIVMKDLAQKIRSVLEA